MKKNLLNSWPSTVTEARDVQQKLKYKVFSEDALGKVRHVAGVDVGFESRGKITRAAVVVLTFPDLVLVEQQLARTHTCFPYVPGYLSFREIPAIMEVLLLLELKPDLILCDGQGLAHPMRFGLACHLGVLTDIPTIGVAKSRLIGSYVEPSESKGSWTPLMDNHERIGAVLRTRDNVRPLFISIGHRISLLSAIDYVLKCTTKYRLPETTRLADHLASAR